jgi:diguanylate cyclase (GGDEF)-like protein
MRFRRLIDLLLPARSDGLIVAQYNSLRSQVPTMYAAILINMLFLGYASAARLGRAAYDVPLVVGVVIAARVVFWWWPGMRRTTPSIAAMQRAMLSAIAVAGVIAIVLSLWTHQILNDGDVAGRGYVALFSALCTFCCAACLSSLPPAAYVVAALGTVPIAAGLIVTGDRVLAGMGINMLAVSPLVIGMVRRQYRQLRDTILAHTDMAAEKAKVSELAYRDPLTGLANRRAFLDTLAAAAAGAQSARLAVAMIDLDDFKAINDSYGHHTGDALLVETARRFVRLDLGDALVARLGGDEFAVLLRDVEHPDDARQRLADLALMFARPFNVDGQSVRLTASIGVAHRAAMSAATVNLVKCADLAMYEAKRHPGSGVHVFEADMAARSERRSGIRRALAVHAENSLIGLRFQPVVAAATNRIVAFEALARWTHPTLGVVAPEEFIPLAEQAGKTEALTGHLLALALEAASTWPGDVGLAFNLSACELGSPTLARRILDLLAGHDFDPGRLSVEVTETALLSDFATARAVLGELRRGGVRILLDDFGAGYASIGYLREIQFDGIKLDGSLIVSLIDSPPAHDLLIGVLRLCRAIGAPVTAEMVENKVQYDLLRALGVEHLQGNLLSRPLTADRALAACRDARIAPEPEPSSVIAFGQRRRELPPA